MNPRPEGHAAERLLPAEITCPQCGDMLVVLVDLAAAAVGYVQECTLCCRPLALHRDRESGTLMVLPVE